MSFNYQLISNQIKKQVIRALEIAIHCSTKQAMRIATIVDREGRTIVQTGPHARCEQSKQVIERRTVRDINRRVQKSSPLEVKILKPALVAYQFFAIRLMNWLTQQAQAFGKR